MSSVFRPMPSGRTFKGTATAVGNFTMTDIDGVSIASIGSNQRAIIYSAFADGTAASTFGFASTVLGAVLNASVAPYGVPLPKATTPKLIALGTAATAVVIHGEIID